MSRPTTHQIPLRASNIKNVKTLSRIQSVEAKTFMSQRNLLQQSGISKQSMQKINGMKIDTNANGSPTQITQTTQHLTLEDLNPRGTASSHTRLQSLTRGSVGGGVADFPQSTISRGSTLGGGDIPPPSLRLDLQRLNEYKTIIDQKERTISDLRTKLKFNESKMSAGGATMMLKSNLMKADSLMNFRINENTDITELKKVLINLIAETQQTEEVLVNRCNKIREMLDLYEARIQFDDMLFLKEKDVQRMNEHIKHLTDSLVNASKNELLFNEKIRETAKCKHDLAMIRSRNEFLEKQNQILNTEVKDLKHQMVIMKEIEMQMNKQKIADQNQLQVMTRRLDTLEKGLEVFQDNRKSKPDDEYKLKNTVNFLIRETQELKKDIQLKKKTIENKDREIQKLLSKIQKFLSQKNEEGIEDDEFGQEQYELAKDKMGNDHFSTNTGSVVQLEDGTLNLYMPSVNKHDEPKKCLEYRFKSMNPNDRSTLTELVESGSQFFVDYLINRGDVQQVKDKFKFVCEQLLKTNKFVEKLNYIFHVPFMHVKKNDEKAIILSIQSDASSVMDKPQRVNLWIRDTLNNELLTYVGEKRLQFETSTDVIGQCCQSQNTVVFQNVRECQFYDDAFERAFEQIDPYTYKERTFVMALPIKHPRTSQVIGVLEICLPRQAQLDDYFMADGLSQISGILLSRFIESRNYLRQSINLRKIVERSKELVEASRDGEEAFGLQIEFIVKEIFGLQVARFVYIQDGRSIWYTDGETKQSNHSLALEVSITKIGIIFGQPEQEKSFNGNIDINTNLPLVCYPIFDYTYLAEKKILGVIEIPQPQFRYSGHSKTTLKNMLIDEAMKDTLDTLSRVISNIIQTQVQVQ
ncbi:UNKNOWN [Stylonychia lemnae]|uniref:GAF domain-containing protein n=1 Tax=Stylonychia lemnae TaxID=5949 RepID=A0A078BEN4_STYLE|nr:UNKNOWN [Stylonychia lemnae]|eukprot:CDW91617.1 UNKNOWN [Stylonychia lemnae]